MKHPLIPWLEILKDSRNSHYVIVTIFSQIDTAVTLRALC